MLAYFQDCDNTFIFLKESNHSVLHLDLHRSPPRLSWRGLICTTVSSSACWQQPLRPNGPQKTIGSAECMGWQTAPCSSTVNEAGMLIDWASSWECTNRKQWKALICSSERSQADRAELCLIANCCLLYSAVWWVKFTEGKKRTYLGCVECDHTLYLTLSAGTISTMRT